MLSNAPVQTRLRLPRDRTEYRMLVAGLDFWPNVCLSIHWQITSFLYNEISRRSLNPYSWQDLSSIYNQCMLVSWCLTNVALWNSFLVLHLVLKRIKEMFCKVIKTGQPHRLCWTNTYPRTRSQYSIFTELCGLAKTLSNAKGYFHGAACSQCL